MLLRRSLGGSRKLNGLSNLFYLKGYPHILLYLGVAKCKAVAGWVNRSGDSCYCPSCGGDAVTYQGFSAGVDVKLRVCRMCSFVEVKPREKVSEK